MIKVVELDQARREGKVPARASAWDLFSNLPCYFEPAHCAPARALLDWSVEALAFRSGVSVKAIKDLEQGRRELRQVTMHALSYAFESEGVLFLPDLRPMSGGDIRGVTPDPKRRSDYHLLE